MNSDIISNLKDKYKFLVNLPEKNFFICIADYIDYINETPELSSIIESIWQERVEDEQRVIKLARQVQLDTKKIALEILTVVEREKISFPELDKAKQEFLYCINHPERVFTPTENLYSDLGDIIDALYKNGYGKIVPDIVKVIKAGNDILDYKISEFYIPYCEATARLSDALETARWGALKKLNEVHNVVYVQRKLNGYLRGGNFSKDQYLNHIFRVHSYIIEKLPKNDEDKIIATLADGFPLELILAGKVLKIQGYALNNPIELITMQIKGTAAILEPIFKICRSKPTTWKTISKKKMETIVGFDKFMLSSVQEVFKNPTRFSKYINGIGLKGSLRKLFVGKIDNQSIRIRTAVTSKDWNSLSDKDKKEVVNTILEKASSRN